MEPVAISRPPPLHRRPRALPLLLMLVLAAVVLFSSSRSSLPVFSPVGSPDTLVPLRRDAAVPPTFSFAVKVLAFDRLGSLRRCLRSLSAADYGGDDVDLHVFVDHFRGLDPVKRSDLLDLKLREARGVLDFLDGFAWRHGKKLVHYRTGNVGLQAQWLEAWWPSSDDEFAFVVEDDLELSPLYYKFLKGLIVKYYYDRSNFSPWVYGASLQRPRAVLGKHGNKLQLDNGTRLFLYQLVGTWGQLLFPRPWKEFRLWYDKHKNKDIKPILQGMATTVWYRSKGEKIWTPWFVKFIHYRGYYNIYTNFLKERALSISHRESGVNYKKTEGPDSFLLNASSLDFDLWETEPLGNLKWYDFCFGQVHIGRIARSAEELTSLLNSFEEESMILLVSLFGSPRSLVSNLLCHFQRLNIRNYILTGNNSQFLLDLARRGSPVIDADSLFDSLKGYGSSHLHHSQAELLRETLVKGYIVKKSLELGHSTWVVETDMIPFADDAFSEPLDPSYDFFASTGTKILYVRSSSTSIKVWNEDIIREIATAAADLDHPKGFVSSALDALEKRSDGRVLRDDTPRFAEELCVTPADGTPPKNGKKMVFWARPTAIGALQGALKNVGLWLIDEDSSCTAVFCHRT